MTDFSDFLEAAKLSTYAAALQAENISSTKTLIALLDDGGDTAALLDLAERAGLKKYHRKRLVNAVKKITSPQQNRHAGRNTKRSQYPKIGARKG